VSGLLGLLLLTAATATAGDLRIVGVLGNSGVQGDALLKTHPGGYPGGVALDDEQTLWRSATPERLERVSLDGRVIAAFPVEGGRMGDYAHNVRVALVGDHVVTLQPAAGLFALRRDAAPGTAMKRLDVKPPIGFWYASGLGARGAGGRAIVDDQKAVWAVDPATGAAAKLFDLPERPAENGLDVGPDGTIWVTTGARTRVYNTAGRIVREGAGTVGRINVAAGSVLAFSYASVQGQSTELESPKALVWNPTVELGRLGQAAMLDARTGFFAAQGGPLYQVAWNGDELALERRFGAVLTDAVGIGPDGEVFCTVPRGYLGWHWDDAADAVPFYSAYHADVLQVRQFATRGLHTWCLKQSWRATEPLQVWTWPPTRYGITYSTLTNELPVRPAGLAVTGDGRMVISGAGEPGLFVTEVRPDGSVNGAVKRLAWPSGNPLRAPGDVCAWGGSRLLVADSNMVVCVALEGDAAREEWRCHGWGQAEEQRFGAEIRLAVGADTLFVSDTARGRVLALALPDRRLLCEARGFHAPAAIAASGMRVVICDRVDQRLVTCEWNP
jgi:hypothetical protein